MIEEFPPNKLADREELKDSGIEELRDCGNWGILRSLKSYHVLPC